MSDVPAEEYDPEGLRLSGLGRSSRRGARSSLLAQGLTQLGSIGATFFLARLLTPAEFGIVAIAQSLLGLATLFSLAGVNAALVTRRGNVDRVASSYFWLAVAVGAIAVPVICLLAAPLTFMLGQPDAAPYVSALSTTFALSLLALVPSALLQRSMRFAWLNGTTLAAAAVYFIAEVVLAFSGLGAWSVVIGQISASVVSLIALFVGARWMPKILFRWSEIRADLRVTGGVGVGQGLTYVQKNADYWVVSAAIGGPALGLYYVAYVLPNIVRLRLAGVLRQVMLPAYALADDALASAYLWRRTIPVSVGLGLPALVGMAAVAGPLVEVFFGAQWADSVAPMRILTVAAVADLFITSATTVAVARKRMSAYVVVLAVRAITTAVFVLLAVHAWASLEAAAWAVAASAAITLFVQELVLSRPLGIGMRTVARSVVGYLVLSCVMVAAIAGVTVALPQGLPAIAQLAIGVMVGVFSYWGTGWLFARALIGEVVVDAWAVLRGR